MSGHSIRSFPRREHGTSISNECQAFMNDGCCEAGMVSVF